MRCPGPLRPAVLTLGLALLTSLLGPQLAADEGPDRQVARRKALFIEQFTRLIEWPAAALPTGAPFVLCIAGGSETAEELTRITAFRKFKDRPCEVRRPLAAREVAACHLLYLAGSEADRLPRTLAAVGN